MMIPLPDLEMENICILHVIVKHTIERVNTKQGAPQNIEFFLHRKLEEEKGQGLVINNCISNVLEIGNLSRLLISTSGVL